MKKGNSSNIPFEKHEVEEYERKRYRGIDQRLVHGREGRLLRNILRKIGDGPLLVLDIPCGYGRFSNILLDKDFLFGEQRSIFSYGETSKRERRTASLSFFFRGCG